MSEVNKKYNRRIRRPCPVCGGRVVVGHRTCSWWVYCEENSSHIPQLWFSYPNDAINQWNLKANRVTNADRLRAMTDEELASYLCKATREGVMMVFPTARYSDEDVRELEHDWLDWLKQEASDG